ncbi:MAG: (d)CMP kinase [Planctomycetota bacterium]
MNDQRLITIDGPAGCGKSTTVRRLAERLGAIAFSSGTIYRALTHRVLQEVSAEDLAAMPDAQRRDLMLRVLRAHSIEVREVVEGDRREFKVHVDGEHPGPVLHSSAVTREVHWVADDGAVREALLPLQREIRATVPIITEGRDMGSVVFPDAPVKIFLTASVDERARRRHRELREKRGEEIAFEEVRADVEARDRFDRSREVGPLIEPDGAVVVDSSGLTIEAVVERILAVVPVQWSEACA